MKLLRVITFDAEESLLTIFLVEKHLYFLPTVGDIAVNLAMLVFMAWLTAYFPARRATKMSVAAALRHSEAV